MTRRTGIAQLIVIGIALTLAGKNGFGQKAPAAEVKTGGSVWEWDIATGHPTSSKNVVPQTAFYSWSQDGSIQAVAIGAEIQITDHKQNAIHLSAKASRGDITALALSKAGDELAVATSTGQLFVWNDFKSAPLVVTAATAADVSCIAFNANGQLLATGGHSLDLWETKSMKARRPSMPSPNPITAVAFGAGDELAAGDFAGNLHIYNASGESSAEIFASSGSVTALAYSMDGSLVAAAGTDGTVKIWGANRNAPVSVLNDQGRILAVGFHPNNSVIAVATSANQVSTWDMASRRRLRSLPLGNNTVAGLVLASNDLLQIGLQVAPPPKVSTLHVLVLLGGFAAGGESADAARVDAVAIADAVQKSGRGSFGRIDQQRLAIDTSVDANAVRETLQAIARDSHPEDALFVYYTGSLRQEQKQAARSLVFANGSTVSLNQVAHWLDDVAALNETIVFDTAGASAEEDSLRGLLSTSKEQTSEHRSRLFVAFDRQSTQVYGNDRAPSTAMLIDGLSGQADQYPKDGKITAGELRTYLDQKTLSNSGMGFKGKYELDGDDFAVVTQGSTRGVPGNPLAARPRSENIFQRRHDYALIIATDDYEFWPKLTNPNPDADAIEAVLRDQYGFQVEVLKDQTQAQVYEALTRYQKKEYQPGDQLLVFIAGHGDFDENAKEGFLVAKDSKLPNVDPVRNTMIPHSRLRNYIDNIPVNHALVLLDVCFGGTFDRGIADAGARGGIYEDQSVDKLFVERAQYTTRKFITSGGKVYVPDGEPGHHSPFVHNLLTELRNPSKDRGYLTFADLLTAVGPTQPAPVWGTWGKDGAGSDFFLISKRTRGAPAAADVPREIARPESVIAARSNICFVGLKNLSGDLSSAVWGDAITEQMTSGLGAGQKLHVISSEDVGRLKRSLAIEDLSSYSRETLLAIRQNTGADLVIAGNFIAAKDAGGLLRVSFTIQNATDGQTIDTLAVTGTQAGIDDLIGRANVLLLSKLGVSNLSSAQLAEVKAGMPTTPEAIKEYSQAMVLLHKGDAQGARELLMKADAAEPGVAFVHRGLSDVWYLLGYDKKAIDEAQIAAKLATGLPKEDLYSMQARESFLSGQLSRAIDRYRYLTMTQPDNLEYGLDLARAESYAGRGKDALVNLADLINLPPPFGGDPRVLIEQAEAYKSLGEFPKFSESARQAQAAAAERGARLLEAEADWEECFAQRNLGNSDAAVTACRQALDIYTHVGEKLGIARSQTGLATALADKGEYAAALSQYQMAADLTESIGARSDRAGALQNIAKTQIAMGQLAEAEVSIDEAIKLAKEAGSSKEERDAYFFRAQLAHTKGDLDKAQEYISDALRIAEDAGDEDAIARAYSYQGLYGLEGGRLSSALAGADKCIEIRTKIQLRSGVAFCQQTRGDIMTAQNRVSDARSAYETSAKIYEEIKQAGDAAAARTSQAELDVETGSAAEGEKLASKAVLEYEAEKDADMETSALCAVLHAEIVQGKRADADKTWASLEKMHPADPDTQRELKIAEARYSAVAGKFDVSLARTAEVASACKHAGLVDCELKMRLLTDQVSVQAGKLEGLDAELKALNSEASRLGFDLVADQANKLLGSLVSHSAQK